MMKKKFIQTLLVTMFFCAAGCVFAGGCFGSVPCAVAAALGHHRRAVGCRARALAAAFAPVLAPGRRGYQRGKADGGGRLFGEDARHHAGRDRATHADAQRAWRRAGQGRGAATRADCKRVA